MNCVNVMTIILNTDLHSPGSILEIDFHNISICIYSGFIVCCTTTPI